MHKQKEKKPDEFNDTTLKEMLQEKQENILHNEMEKKAEHHKPERKPHKEMQKLEKESAHKELEEVMEGICFDHAWVWR